jgi:uncharacterized repeat protein (TIGR02543 family)
MKTFGIVLLSVLCSIVIVGLWIVIDINFHTDLYFYTVSYNANTENYQGTIPTDATNYHTKAQVCVMGKPSIMVIEDEGGFAGLKFTGWNTKSDGTGDNYIPGSIFEMPKHNVILFANWQSVDKPGVLSK